MTGAEFRRRFHDLDAVAVETLWRVYLESRDIPGARSLIVSALTRLEEQAHVAAFAARRSHSDSPPQPAVAQHPVAVP